MSSDSNNSDYNDTLDEDKYQRKLAQATIAVHAAMELISHRMALRAGEYRLEDHCYVCGGSRITCQGHAMIYRC